ncbi:MAG: hypothetical protein OXG11_09840, partial [Chloroflexi bacterium]|nr:hypothetical protein [Chloroflexota bacterium]
WIAGDLEAFNASIGQAARDRIAARQKELVDDQKLAERLGYPTRRAIDVSNALPESEVALDGDQRPSPLSTDAKSRLPPCDMRELGHEIDFRRVCGPGLEFKFGPKSAHAIAILHERFMEDMPDVNEDCLLKKVGSTQGSLYELIRRSGAWNKLVIRGKFPGTVRLNLSNPAKDRQNP